MRIYLLIFILWVIILPLFADFYRTLGQCRLAQGDCSPCLPLCCVQGLRLSFHQGWRCLNSTINYDLEEIKSKLNVENEVHFFHSGLPECSKEELVVNHFSEIELELGADLELRLPKGTKVVQSLRSTYYTSLLNTNPFITLCLDATERNNKASTIIVSCNRRLPLKQIPKCCSKDYSFSNASLNFCQKNINKKHYNNNDFVLVEGHGYSEEELDQNGLIAYPKINNEEETLFACTNENMVRFASEGNFGVDKSGQLQFTSLHDKIEHGVDFCIDYLEEEVIDSHYDYNKYDDYYNDNEINDDYGIEEIEYSEKCENKWRRLRNPSVMRVVLYCKQDFMAIRKCCGQHQILNMRTKACVDDPDHIWQNPLLFDLSKKGEPMLAEAADKEPSTLYMNIVNMIREDDEHQALYVAHKDFYLLTDGQLLFKDRLYDASSYCLDLVVDFCASSVPKSSAVMRDASLSFSAVVSVLGSDRVESQISIKIRKFGFPISILALFLAISVFFMLRELRKDLHGKLVLALLISQFALYSLLFIRALDLLHVSKSDFWCRLNALATYFFVISSFAWTTAMAMHVTLRFM